MMLVLEVAERRLARVDSEPDGAASPAVPTIRSPERDVCLAPERRGARAAVAGAQPDLYLVKEHAGSFSHRPAAGSIADRQDPPRAGGTRQ